MLGRALNKAGCKSSIGVSAAPAPVLPQLRQVRCLAAADMSTAWDSWTPYMQSRKSVLEPNPSEKQYFTDIGAMISKAAVGYKPKFSVPHEPHGASFKLQHVDKIQVKELPSDLHDKLEAVGVATLKGALQQDGELDYLNASYTTTDIDGALSVTGTVVKQGSDKSAVVVLVATETERQASWSRLEGLILHWACSAGGGAWTMPPEGWSVIPNKARDAGGAWQCQFEKQVVGANESLYVLVMQLPLRGVLKTGGLVFVLKGTANQTDRWLKDAATDKDFYLDLQKLPVTAV